MRKALGKELIILLNSSIHISSFMEGKESLIWTICGFIISKPCDGLRLKWEKRMLNPVPEDFILLA